MSTKCSSADLENAVQAYCNGSSILIAAKSVHTSQQRLSAILKARGLFREKRDRYSITRTKGSATKCSRRPIPDVSIATRYVAGESATSLAKEFGVNRWLVNRWLSEMGIKRRTRIEGATLYKASVALWRQLPDTVITRYLGGTSANTLATELGVDRASITLKLRDAGIPIRSDRTQASLLSEARCRQALTRQQHGTHVGIGETLLAQWLATHDISAIPQQAIGPYNTDLGAFPVAVEILGGAWQRYNSLKSSRLRYILDQGWNLMLVWLNPGECPLTVRACEDILAFIQQSRSDPAFRRQYRVIWSNGQVYSTGEINLDDLADPKTRTACLNRRP